jgi:hypothetical protein
VNRALDELAENDELAGLLGCSRDDPRFLALLERLRRAFAIPSKGQLKSRLKELSASVDRTPGVVPLVTARGATEPAGTTSATPRAHDVAGRLGEAAAVVAQEYPGFFYASQRPTDVPWQVQTTPETHSRMELEFWIAEEPSIIDSFGGLDQFEASVRELLHSSRDYLAVQEKVRAVREELASALRDPPRRTPRARRALLRLSDRLAALFPLLTRAARDEVVHLLGEEFGVASLGEEGTEPEDRAKVRRAHVAQWRRDNRRPRRPPR